MRTSALLSSRIRHTGGGGVRSSPIPSEFPRLSPLRSPFRPSPLANPPPTAHSEPNPPNPPPFRSVPSKTETEWAREGTDHRIPAGFDPLTPRNRPKHDQTGAEPGTSAPAAEPSAPGRRSHPEETRRHATGGRHLQEQKFPATTFRGQTEARDDRGPRFARGRAAARGEPRRRGVGCAVRRRCLRLPPLGNDPASLMCKSDPPAWQRPPVGRNRG